MTAVIVPYDQLNPDSLNGVIEEFVTRDGTDYGEIEVSLEAKISRVLSLLKSGKAVIVFDNLSETCTILKSDDPVLKSI
ncbi:MAG: YheU family protein [Desulfobacteraceae bacterium]|nr:YheU family protein [Desulfobacteraceae bacterium]